MKTNRNQYFFVYILLLSISCLIIWNLSPNPSNSITDDKKYLDQATKINRYGVSKGFTVLTKQYLSKQSSTETSSQPKGHHPLRVGRIVLHSAVYSINKSVMSGSYISIAFFVLLGIFIYWWVGKYWSPLETMAICTIVIFSPFLMGYSARALIETQHYFFMLGMLFFFIDFIHKPTNRNLGLFIIITVLSILFKETAGLFFPFFVLGVLAAKLFYNKSISYIQIASIVILVPLLLLCVYVLIFGFQNLYDIITHQTNRHIVNERSQYHIRDKDGPWYQYFLDFFILSPLVSILFFLFVGFFLAKDKDKNNIKDVNIICFLAFFVSAFIIFSILIKHVRYAIFLDFIYRFASVSFLFILVTKWVKEKYQLLAVFSMLMILLVVDMVKYKRFFVDQKLTKVWSRSLFNAEGFFKDRNPSEKLQLHNTFVNYANEHYEAKKYELAIDYAQKALGYKTTKKDSKVYYILCGGYYNLNQMENAVPLCKKVVELSEIPTKNKKLRRANNKRAQESKKILTTIELSLN